MQKFVLAENFVNKYKRKKPPFGFNGFGELVYMRTYSRIKPNGKNEKWWETVRRVVEGTYNMQKKWIESNDLEWNPWKAQRSAQEMYDRIYNMKFLPPGRGLWAMGSPITEERGAYAALFNCAFFSTEDIDKEFTKPFCFMMDMSMLGVGVGFDVKGENKVAIKGPNKNRKPEVYQIPDDREGWVESLRLLLTAYAYGTSPIEFDYGLIRGPGKPIRGFGGVSSGPAPLKKLHEQITKLLDSQIGQPISARIIVDIMNMIGVCVVAGNVRRTAQIVFGSPDSEEYLDLKNYKVNPERSEYGWSSNNSIFAEVGMDYSDSAERTRINGEPGYIWMENVRAYSRMCDPPDWKDDLAKGANPCLPKEALVLTKNGISDIGSIEIGDKIWSKDGWVTVTNKFSNGIKDIYSYKTTAGTFIGTKNHKVSQNGELIEVKDAECLDRLAGPEYREFLATQNSTIMDGLVIGDGYKHKASNNLIVLCIGTDDGDYFNSEISSLIGKHRPGIGDTSYEIDCDVKPKEMLHKPNMVIPERYFRGDKYKVASFLRGLYSANGSICGKRVTLKATSFTLINQVQTMLSSIGINSYYTTNKSKKIMFSNGEYCCKQSYDLNITGIDRQLFCDQIGFIQKYKQDALREICLNAKVGNKKISFDIKEVDFVRTDEVFDITVDGESHTFWNNGLDVSNCNEQSLQSGELCCLVETFPHNHESLEDYKQTLKYAYLYGKTVTLAKTHWKETNRIMLRNRRIGTSMSGIAQFITYRGLDELKRWCDEGYKNIQRLDAEYSDWLAIPKSIKTTSIKPSGSVSLLAGATPGMHYPESNFYIRRMRLSIHSELVKPLQEAGYSLEPAKDDPENTLVVSVPIDIGKEIRTVNEVSVWEQFSLASFLQAYWADNQVSCTVTFKPEDGYQLEPALNYFQYSLKGISMLPKLEMGAYEQMPYEEITEEEFVELNSKIKPISFGSIKGEEAEIEKFCNNDTCEIVKN